MQTLKVQIWSDVLCPFCYIGKRQFENAASELAGEVKIELEWKSFQLDPSAKTDASKKAIDHLKAKYGWSHEQALQAMSRVSGMASDLGLQFEMEQTRVVNSFNAHRLTYLAKSKGRQNELKEKLFSAHFCEGKNIDNPDTLLELGLAVGLSESDIRHVLNSDAHASDVQADRAVAEKIGVRGVPHFVINEKWAISGAQGAEAFSQALRQIAAMK